MSVMFRSIVLALLSFCYCSAAVAQDQAPVERVPVDKNAPPPKDNREAPPRSDKVGVDESSSKETEIDVTPPAGDAKDHPEADLASEDNEFHPWDPHKAMKSIEVGDFYFKRENYAAAISRYREALEFKPRDAEATYKLAEALEKSGDPKGALESYRDYLKILPKGPNADKAHEGIDRLKDKVPPSSAKAGPQSE